MPRETIHLGRDYARVSVAASGEHSAYEYELAPHEAKARQGDTGISSVTYSTKPHLDLLWSRPMDAQVLPVGEDSTGSVQVSISLAPQDMQWRIDHLAKHPEDLEDFSTVFTEPLTRKQINHMIRTLRRARDAAYESDE